MDDNSTGRYMFKTILACHQNVTKTYNIHIFEDYIDFNLIPKFNASTLRYVAQSSTASDDDLQHITHGGSVSEAATSVSVDDSAQNSYHEDIPGLGQYDDFHTIDWQRDIARDRTRHR